MDEELLISNLMQKLNLNENESIDNKDTISKSNRNNDIANNNENLIKPVKTNPNSNYNSTHNLYKVPAYGKKKSFMVRKKSGIMVSDEEITIDDLIEILSKRSKDRSNKEHFIVQTYLSKTDLITKLKKQLTDEATINRIITALANGIEIKEYSKDKTIFRVGEIGDFFYFVLKGKVKLFKPTFIEYHLTPIEYFHKLINI